MAKVLTKAGYDVIGSDIIDRGYKDTKIINFVNPSLEQLQDWKDCFKDRDIITNPPYSLLSEFLERGLSNLQDGHKLAIFVRLQALEGKQRRRIYDKYPIYKVYVASSRLKCYPNGIRTDKGSAVAYCWIIWKKNYKGPTTMEWLD